MKKQILKYTIRTHKKDNNLIEIFVRDYPSFTRPFTTFSVNWGHNEACEGYYTSQTRPANEKEIESIKETTLKTFIGLYGDDYDLQYLKTLAKIKHQITPQAPLNGGVFLLLLLRSCCRIHRTNYRSARTHERSTKSNWGASWGRGVWGEHGERRRGAVYSIHPTPHFLQAIQTHLTGL